MKLNEDLLDGLTPGKRHSDGGNLYFERRANGAASWLFRTPTSWMSLGEYPEVSLTEARAKAADARALLKKGKDPVRARQAADAAAKAALARSRRTVEEATRDYWKNKCQNLARKDGWIRMMEIHLFPKVGKLPVGDLTAEDVVRVLEPIWKGSADVRDGETGFPTAKRVRDRLKLVLTRERVTGSLADPFICDVARELLPSVEWEEKPHPALRWQDVPDLWLALPTTIAGLGLRLCILTGLRVACVTYARWAEVDFAEKVWTVPKGRVKGWEAGFRVPLTGPITDVLREAERRTGKRDYIFASDSAHVKGVISENTWNSWLRENNWKDVFGDPVTAHGFRSTFRDWAAKHKWARDLAEHSIQHVSAKGTKTERAYWREDRLEDRAELLVAWNDFVVSKEVAQRMAAGARQRALDRLDEVVLADGRTLREAEEWARYDGLEGEVDTSQPADD